MSARAKYQSRIFRFLCNRASLGSLVASTTKSAAACTSLPLLQSHVDKTHIAQNGIRALFLSFRRERRDLHKRSPSKELPDRAVERHSLHRLSREQHRGRDPD